MPRPLTFSYTESIDWLRDRVEQGCADRWDREKMKLLLEDGRAFRMPWPFPVPEAGVDLEEYVDELDTWIPPFYLILMQAGHSALGYFEGGELVFHKTIKKYMVRRKHGKAQIGHLSTRGKSKAGSRIRLANTVQFFEDINAKLEEWALEDEVSSILYSCPVRMLPLWFGSKVKPPFAREDERLRKVPVDIHRPGLEELERVAAVGMRGYLLEE